MKKALRTLVLAPDDTVAVLLENGQKGDTILVHNQEITLLEDIQFAHKVLIKDSIVNSPVIKYGTQIGYMLENCGKGTWLHGHNMGCDRGKKRRSAI
ncbi:UxaA family hydrolase [Desulforhopalus singaporensis]|nr:UxaA family hydrolase [Desulforhopalus singaporensis]